MYGKKESLRQPRPSQVAVLAIQQREVEKGQKKNLINSHFENGGEAEK